VRDCLLVKVFKFTGGYPEKFTVVNYRHWETGEVIHPSKITNAKVIVDVDTGNFIKNVFMKQDLTNVNL
jgi:hypothetical protein